MLFTRRAFIGAASAASALLAGATNAKPASSSQDPLGVRADFPGVEKTIFFDSAYTALSPRQAAEALGDHQYRLHTDGRKYQYATMSFGAVYHLNAALEYILGIGVANIERHTVGLAHRLREGLASQGFDIDTPAGNAASIVTFQHGRDAKEVRHDLKAGGVKINISDNQSHLRVGIALYNNAEEVDQFLELTGNWK